VPSEEELRRERDAQRAAQQRRVDELQLRRRAIRAEEAAVAGDDAAAGNALRGDDE
jgi:hypothetical protein